LNEKEAMDFTGKESVEEAAEELFAENQNTVIITVGAKGVYLKGKETCWIATTKVEAMDTIGAGDSHIGSVIAMRQKGLGMQEAIQVANRVSALVVGVPGPTLTKEEFQEGCIYTD
jgi:sugar/nucleoside kinase (ribokinase family)